MSPTSGTVAPPATEHSFADLGATPATLTSLARVGIEHPFPIQTLCLPLALAGVDLIGQARTGTGKTLAFGIPIVQEVEPAAKVQALVLVPTRELCPGGGRHRHRRPCAPASARSRSSASTPSDRRPQRGRPGRGRHPGRVLDHLRQGHLKLDKVRILVVDEADEMLDPRFLPTWRRSSRPRPSTGRRCCSRRPCPRRWSPWPGGAPRRPTFVHAEPEGSHATVPARQLFFQVHPLNRFQVLCRILDAPDRDRVAVFRTKRGVDRTIKGLLEEGYRAGALHGDMPQVVREKVMRSFRKGKLDVLVCTDVASRGLDIASLSHVINYDTPEDDRAYVHRIGRTGRAGAPRSRSPSWPGTRWTPPT